MIELFGSDFKMIRPIDTALRVGYAQKLNDLSTAELLLATDDPATEQIVLPSSWARVWDGDENVGMFRFKAIAQDDKAPGGTIIYQMLSAQCTLTDCNLVGHHELGGDGLNTRWVMEYILSRQTVRYWQLGECDFNDYYQYNFEDVNLLTALMSLRETVIEDNAMIFEAYGAPPWTVHFKRLNSEAASSLVVGRSMKAIRRTVDGQIVTRLYGRGYGEGDNQMTIASVNGGRDYLDADPQTMALHGGYVFEGYHTDRRQVDPLLLKARMQVILEHGKTPRASYSATAYDLYEVTKQRWDQHRAGDCVLVLDEALGRSFKTRITAREKPDVDGDPGGVNLTMDNGVGDVAEALNAVLDKIGVQELYAQGATTVYSQQIADSADSSHPLEMSFYVPGNMTRINKCLLSWQIERFRSYTKITKAGGEGVRTSSEGGGATVTTPSQTVSLGVKYSSQPMDAEGSGAGLTGGPKDYLGNVNTSTSQVASHAHNMTHVHPIGANNYTFTFVGTEKTYSIGHNHSLAGEGALATGAIYSGNKSIKVTPEGEIEPPAVMWTATSYASQSGGDTKPATGENGAHSHTFSHVHDMPHVHNIAHEHTIPSLRFTLSSHAHTVEIPEHTHELEYGIYEGGRAQSVSILVDGTQIPASDVEDGDREVDIAPYMRANADGKIMRGTWHKVAFVPDTLTRITANLFFQVFIQSRGAGDY